MSAEVRFEIYNLPDQELVVYAQGSALKLFATHADPVLADSEQVTPDVVDFFVRCAQLGFFCGREHVPAVSGAVLMSTGFDSDQVLQVWRLRTQAIDPGAFRVLLNLLTARQLVLVKMKTVAEPARIAAALVPATVAYPAVDEFLPFRVDHTAPVKSTEDRSLHITFVDEPTDTVLDQVYAVLQVWTDLLLLGGYAPQGLPPSQSGTIPDMAFLYDPVTVEQAFSEVFICDEAAFDAIINWAIGFHINNPIKIITIR